MTKLKKYIVCCDATIEVLAKNSDDAIKKALDSEYLNEWEFSNYCTEEEK